MDKLKNQNPKENDDREWDAVSDCETVSSDGTAGDFTVPRSKKDHRIETFLKRKVDDLGSSSGGRGALAKKADRRTIHDRTAGAPGGNQSSSEDHASALGSDQERRADFAKTVESAFRQVALKKKKASRDSAIEAATASITAATVSNFGLASKSELAKLQEQVARLTAALGSLQEENRSLRADLTKMREQEAKRGEAAARQQVQTAPAESQILALVRQEMAAFQARFSVLEGKVLRPPPSRRRSPQRPKGPLMRLRLQRHPRPLSQRRTDRPAKAQGRNCDPGAEHPGANRAPVVGEKKKRRNAAKAAKKKAQKRLRRERAAAAQLHAPKIAAVVLTLQPDTVKRGVSYRYVLAKAKEAVSLTKLGITEDLRLRISYYGQKESLALMVASVTRIAIIASVTKESNYVHKSVAGTTIQFFIGRSYIHFTEPECEHGESLPAPDACNLCICMNNHILCTEYPCLERKVTGRSGQCTEGDRYYLEDRCNFCVCQEGKEFCTARACLVDVETSPKDKCKEGEMTKSSDGCNMCVCTEGILSCTDFQCSKSRLRKDPLDTGGFKPFSYLKSKEKAKCVEGKMYVNEEDDPHCPDTCFCDNGELLCTNRKCDWGHGKAQFQEPPPKSSLSPNNMTSDFVSCVDYEEMPADDACSVCMCLNNRRVCTKVHCTESEPNVVSSRLADVDNLIPTSKASFGASCVDYEEMPSSFACTSCICLHSRKVCTKTRCPESHTPQLAVDENKANQNRNAKNKEIFCEPFTFYSPDNNRYCRNCFCLHNGLALCLLNLCKYSKEVEHKSRLFESGCIPGETVNPSKCLTCTCSDQNKWVCYGKALRECQERDCDAKDEFHMGFLPYCAECQCSLKEWFCSIKPRTCKDHSNAKCPMGTLIQNPNQHCSVCLCGGTEPGSQNMCFTEVKCVKQVINHLIN
ncbi:uncharacterized protein LOC124636029 [Helicoverpa zea]|uniref:uncharacterized protein LOC124636029 n=1 Tax=Helicoverpa zea TaxID=7113 RepID=UPI001F560732|nr:uncharacterized protein LOC124636029 [Helicoverpa zea]